MPTRHFLVPGALSRKTGGSIYDRRVVEGMRAQGHDVTVHELAEDYPFPSASSRAQLRSCLDEIPTGSTVVIDGLISGAVPEIITDAAQRLRIVALVHHPLADETGQSAEQSKLFLDSERQALSQVSAAIVTSPFTKRRLAEFVPPDTVPVHVAIPGTDPKPLAKGHDEAALSLLCVASLTRRKGYPILLKALSGLTHLPWQLVCVGSRSLDPNHAAEIALLAQQDEFSGRVTLLSDLSEEELIACYNQADLFVFPSLYEGFGMVIQEAIAHGLPIITTTGGALVDTAPEAATLFTPPGDVAAFGAALERVMTEPNLRAELTAGAQSARRDLPSWNDTAQRFASILEHVEATQGAC